MTFTQTVLLILKVQPLSCCAVVQMLNMSPLEEEAEGCR